MSWKNRLQWGLAWTAPGFTSGLAAVLFLSRWTWLEMRWNSGRAWWAITVAFIIFGLLYGKGPRWRWTLLADGLLLLALWLTCHRGGLGVLPAALFRESLGWDSLSLAVSGRAIVAGWLVTHLLLLGAVTGNPERPGPGRKEKDTWQVGSLMLVLQASRLAAEAMARGHNCCEAVLLAADEIWHLNLAPDTMAAGALFREGMGSGCSCGALIGLVMVSGILFQRYGHPLGPRLSPYLYDRFKQEFGSSCCRVICKQRPLWGRVGKKACRDLTARTATLMVEIWGETVNRARKN
ncbi:MAG: hypothetical protein PWP41_1156 [Moorella sp. (in: firmicutes)]|nr:hypothetical protein [Moorella sp. (in: firmicutes)]